MIICAEIRSRSLSFRFPVVEDFSLGYTATFKFTETQLTTAPAVGRWLLGRCNDIALKTTLVAGLQEHHDESYYYKPAIPSGAALVKFVEQLHDLCLPPSGRNELELCRLYLGPASVMTAGAGTVETVMKLPGVGIVQWFAQSGVVTEVQASFPNLVAKDGYPLIAHVSLTFTPYAGTMLQESGKEPMAPGPSRPFSFTKMWDRYPAGSTSGGEGRGKAPSPTTYSPASFGHWYPTPSGG